MDTQLARTHHDHQHHHHEPLDLQDAGGIHTTTEAAGEEHHHGGVKSVLRKVKQKAKKVKDTLKVHGHHDLDHDHHHQNAPDDHDLDEEEDDDVDQEMIEDPAVHGASGHEAAIAVGLRSGVPGKSAATMQPDYYDGGYSAADSMKMPTLDAGENRGGHERKLADIREEPVSPFNSPAAVSTAPVIAEHPRGSEPARAFVAQQEEDRGHPQITMDELTGGLEEDPHRPKGSSGDHRSPSNHQTKVTDQTGTGGEEAAIPPTLLESLEKAHISEEGRHSQRNDGGLRRRTHDLASAFPTGSHDQFSPEASRPQPMSNFESAKHEDKMKTHVPVDHIGEKAQSQSSYSDKLSSAAAVIADKAISAKNVVASKLGYGDDHQQDSGASNSASPVGYGKKIAATVTEKLTPVYETVTSTVASAGTTVMSKVQGGGGGGGESTGNVVTDSEMEYKGQQDKGVSVKDYLAEKLKPTEDDKALSDVISESMPWGKTAASDERKPMGEVTESEEVKRRLGTGDERERKEEMQMEVEDSSVSIPGVGGVAGKLKGAVESWFGKGQQQQYPRSSGDQSIGSTTGTRGFPGSGDDRQQGTGRGLPGSGI